MKRFSFLALASFSLMTAPLFSSDDSTNSFCQKFQKAMKFAKRNNVVVVLEDSDCAYSHLPECLATVKHDLMDEDSASLKEGTTNLLNQLESKEMQEKGRRLFKRTMTQFSRYKENDYRPVVLIQGETKEGEKVLATGVYDEDGIDEFVVFEEDSEKARVVVMYGRI